MPHGPCTVAVGYARLVRLANGDAACCHCCGQEHCVEDELSSHTGCRVHIKQGRQQQSAAQTYNTLTPDDPTEPLLQHICICTHKHTRWQTCMHNYSTSYAQPSSSSTFIDGSLSLVHSIALQQACESQAVHSLLPRCQSYSLHFFARYQRCCDVFASSASRDFLRTSKIATLVLFSLATGTRYPSAFCPQAVQLSASQCSPAGTCRQLPQLPAGCSCRQRSVARSGGSGGPVQQVQRNDHTQHRCAQQTL